MDRKIKHLELVQSGVSRLASDSFRMKGWCNAERTAESVRSDTTSGRSRGHRRGHPDGHETNKCRHPAPTSRSLN